MGYQIKVKVKNTKPIVWRKLVIPEGITFSALAVILNEIFDLEQTDTFQFEFYHRKVQLEEAQEGKVFHPNFHYDLQDASSTYIDDYFGKEAWCSYYHGQNAFRIEIEERNEINFAILVLGARGAFQDEAPELMALSERLKSHLTVVSKSPVHYEKIMEMTQQQPVKIFQTDAPITKSDNLKKCGDSLLTDMAEGLLKVLGQKENGEVLRNAYNGIKKNPLEENETQLLRTMTKDTFQEFNKKFRSNYATDGIGKSKHGAYYLRDWMMQYTKADLINIAREMHIRRYTSLSVAALAEKIANELLSKNVMREKFSLFTDEEIRAFEYGIKQDGLFEPSKKQLLDLLKGAEDDYVMIWQNGQAEVPIDVKEAYQKINTEDFHQYRKQRVWLVDCLDMVDDLYMVAPLEILMKMYQTRKGYRLSKDTLLEMIEQLPDMEKTCVYQNGKIISKSNGKWVFCKHKDRDTYEIPGGHREPGEDIETTARRELYEETGAKEYHIKPVCVYSVTAPDNFDGVETFGMLYFAEIDSFEEELHSEIEKIYLLEELPAKWTYPLIQPRLMEEVQRRDRR